MIVSSVPSIRIWHVSVFTRNHLIVPQRSGFCSLFVGDRRRGEGLSGAPYWNGREHFHASPSFCPWDSIIPSHPEDFRGDGETTRVDPMNRDIKGKRTDTAQDPGPTNTRELYRPSVSSPRS